MMPLMPQVPLGCACTACRGKCRASNLSHIYGFIDRCFFGSRIRKLLPFSEDHDLHPINRSISNIYPECFPILIAATLSHGHTGLSIEEKAIIAGASFCTAVGALNHVGESRTRYSAVIRTYFIVTVCRTFHGCQEEE